jgi:uncharacterized membrane protein
VKRLWRPDLRWFVLAVVVGIVLRLAWVLWIGAVEPQQPFSDTGRNLEMARDFAAFESYRLNGVVTAFNAPGYSVLLTPAAFIAHHTGWFELPIAAALLNVVAGGAGVALGGVLAGLWFGVRARTVAAWLLALAAGPIYLTVVPLTETVFTTLVLAVLVVVTLVLQEPTRATRRTVVLLGALIAITTLVRPPGLLLALVALVALRIGRGSWAAIRRPAAGLVAVVAVVLLPWFVHNGVRVGVWTPLSTNSAAFLCQGHGEHAKADVQDMTEADFAYCFLGGPFDPEEPDEAEWAPRITRRAVGWALTHPAEEIELTWDKTYATMANDHQALGDAADFGQRTIVGGDTFQTLDRLGELWHRLVLVLGLVALVAVPRARQAWPLWATGAAFVAVVWGGNALDRYHHTTMAILAVFAAALVARLHPVHALRSVRMNAGRPAVRERRQVPTKTTTAEAAPTDAPAPPTPEQGVLIASRPRSPVSGPYGRPFHPMIAAVAIGAWVCSFGFDLISQVADTAWVYARGAYVLVGVGVVVGVIAATVGLIDLVNLPRGTRAFRTGVRHLLAMDAALLAFAASFLVRRTSEFRWHDGVEPAAMALSVVGLVALAVGVWLGSTLSYRYGVRVAVDAERRDGFETGGASATAAVETVDAERREGSERDG